MNIFLNKLFTFFECLTTLYRTIHRINSALPPLKLIAIEEINEKEPIFIVQISGKNLFPRLKLRQFIHDNTILKFFNPTDQQNISRYLPKIYHPIIYKISAITLDRKAQHTVFTITHTDNKIKKQIQTNNVFQLAKHIHFFDQEDAFLIGVETTKKLRIIESSP